MRKDELDSKVLLLLITMARLGGGRRLIGSSELAESLGVSRPTVSRWINKAVTLGYVEKLGEKRRQSYMLTSEGIKVLHTICERMRAPLSVKRVAGEVVSGLGEGSYYMSLDGYKSGFMRILGYVPFPGTLNLRIKSESHVLKILEWISEVKPAIIPGFSTKERTFGDVKIYPVILNGRLECHAVFPERGHYNYRVLEVVWRDSIRKELSLKDGDIVIVDLIDWETVGRVGLEPTASASSRRRHSH